MIRSHQIRAADHGKENKLRINAFILAGLLSFSIGGIGCCSDGKNTKNSIKSRAVFDGALGLLEKEVLKKYGEPKETNTAPAKELKGELRASLRSKVPSEDTLVKELYYKFENKERIFWLTQQNGIWKVISDVEIPKGVIF